METKEVKVITLKLTQEQSKQIEAVTGKKKEEIKVTVLEMSPNQDEASGVAVGFIDF